MEIHKAGTEASATFKWSRENGSVVVAVTGLSGSQVYVDSLGPDANLGFAAGQWVEIYDDSNLFGLNPNQPGDLYQIQSVDPTTLSVTMTQPVASVNPILNARMRRWDQSGASAGANGIVLSAGTWLDLENGIQVEFGKGNYQSGDYWLIPARTATGQIEWPPCASDGNAFQPAHRTKIFVAPLACIQWISAERKPHVQDCRKSFYPLTELTPPTAATALHIARINWSNDDVMTLDQLILQTQPGTVALTNGSVTVTGAGTSFTTLSAGQWLAFSPDGPLYQIGAVASDTSLTLTANYKGENTSSASFGVSGLTVTLDATAPASPYVTPANFIVTLELALPIGTSVTDRLTAAGMPEASVKVQSFLDSFASSQAIQIIVNQEGFVALIRLEIILDGETSASGSNLMWQVPWELKNPSELLTLEMIDALLLVGALKKQVARARVKLLGERLFTGSSVDALYLDGQTFGVPALRTDGVTPRIDLQFPSGRGAKASDFESWFYLAPTQRVASLTLNYPNLLVDPKGTVYNANVPTAGAVSPQGTVTLAYPAMKTTVVSLSIGGSSAAGIFSIPASITFSKNQTQATFAITVQGNPGTKAQSWPIMATLPTSLGNTSATETLTITGFQSANNPGGALGSVP